jgi:anti-anti-sigma factor
MLFETETCGTYTIIRIQEDITLHHNPSNLKKVIEELVATGVVRIALAFTPGTYPSSRLIAVLATSREMLKRSNGDLAIIAPSEKMVDTFSILNLAHNGYFTIVDSEEQLSVS